MAGCEASEGYVALSSNRIWSTSLLLTRWYFIASLVWPDIDGGPRQRIYEPSRLQAWDTNFNFFRFIWPWNLAISMHSSFGTHFQITADSHRNSARDVSSPSTPMEGRDLERCWEFLEKNLYPTREELRALAEELNLFVVFFSFTIFG